jgi:hypothetical protein
LLRSDKQTVKPSFYRCGAFFTIELQATPTLLLDSSLALGDQAVEGCLDYGMAMVVTMN